MNSYEENENLIPLSSEKSIASLKRKLASVKFENQLPILTQISGLLGHRNLALLLSLAVKNFHFGNEGEAYKFLGKAKEVDANDQNVMRVELFFSVAIGDGGGIGLCEKLLEIYPDDSWAMEMKEKLSKGDVSSISLPAVSSEW